MEEVTVSISENLKKKLLEVFSTRNLLVSPAVLDKLSAVQPEQALQLAEKCAGEARGFVVTEQDLQLVLESSETQAKIAPPAQEVMVQHTEFKPLYREVASQLKIKEESNVSGKSRCTGTVEDFVGFFRDRYRRVKGILKGRMGELPLVDISSARGFARGRTGRIIAMVAEKKTTKNNHILLEVEDEEASLSCLIPANSPIREKGDDILTDEVIAIDGNMGDGLFIVRDVIWPEVPIPAVKKTSEEGVAVACTSDIHVGSRFFLKENFTKFLSFLNGAGTVSEQEMAGKIKYITLAGDLVDGIGVYPGQEKELVTKDIYTQYEILWEYLKMVPEDIEVIVAPGNHDAVRSAIPQPRLAKDFTKGVEGYGNIHFISNPCQLSAHGFNVVVYHGATMYSMINALPKLRGAILNPEKVGVEMLRRRLLHPVYGDTPIAPEKRDYGVLEEIPDIFHFGDIHRNGYTNYRGTMVINGGCWQSITDYQVRLGHQPTPCQVPVYSLKTNNLQVLNFAGEQVI